MLMMPIISYFQLDITKSNCIAYSMIKRRNMLIGTNTPSAASTNHARSRLRTKVATPIRGLHPARAAEFIAHVIAKERANSSRSQIGHAVHLVPRQYDRIGEDDRIGVHSSLQIAQDEVSKGDMVRKMTQGLHHLRPRSVVVGPTGVGIEFLIVL